MRSLPARDRSVLPAAIRFARVPAGIASAVAAVLARGACAGGSPLAMAAPSGAAGPAAAAPASAAPATASAIFLHPDGMGANTWTAARLAAVGPDGRLAWDRLPAVAVYVGPLLDRVTATSNGGGTSHAWGVRAAADSFGRIGGERIPRARSGATVPLMIEARQAGKRIGVVNTASVTDAGTGVHLADVASRRDHASIAAQMLGQEPEVMLGGGEQWFLPEGVTGRHGAGRRTDGRNLVEEARAKGYLVVHTAEELARVPAGTRRLLGLFAAEDTFADFEDFATADAQAQPFLPGAPRYDAMVAAALRVLEDAPRGFLLVAEEEATDNLGGANHARGVIEAATGADRAIALAEALAARRGDVTVVVASDSDCGGLQVGGDDVDGGTAVAAADENGAPIDGATGPRSAPFLAAPDRAGRRLPFAIQWAASGDMSGGLVARGTGPGARLLQGTIDSTDVYSALYLGLFGREPGLKP